MSFLRGSMTINALSTIIMFVSLVIKQFDSSVVKRTPAIIKTHFLAGKVFVIAEQINAMKEYSKNFAAYANNIEASVEKFEQAVEFFKKNKIVL